MGNFDYQRPIVKASYKDMKEKGKVVLAGCPGAGKTHMGIDVLELFLKDNPEGRVLILAHGQTLLREQWYERLDKFCKHSDVGIWERGSDTEEITHKIVVAIPQTLLYVKDLPRFDLIVVDEAHHYYLAGLAEEDEETGMVQRIITDSAIRQQLLLTGTPARLIREGFTCHGITLSELLDLGRATNVYMQLAKMASSVTMADYKNKDTMEISPSHVFTGEEANETLDNLLVPMRRWVLENMDIETRTWAELTRAIKKTLIACYSIQEASVVQKYFEEHGVKSLITTSEHEKNCAATIDKFKTDDATVLIVVRRGILGFDFPDLGCIIDISASLNVDRIFQLLCRLVRVGQKDPNQKKLFFKLTTDAISAATYHVMSYVCALSVPEYYYAVTEYQTTPIPVKKEFKTMVDGYTRARGKTAPNLKDLPSLPTFAEMPRRGEKIETIAYTDFKTVRQRLYGKNNILDEASARELALTYKTYSEFRKTSGWSYFQSRKLLHKVADIFPEILKNLDDFKTKVYTLADVKDTIAKVSTRNEMKIKHNKIYKFALENHRPYLDEHLPSYKWDLPKVKATIKKAQKEGIRSRKKFREKYPGAYDFLDRNDMTELITEAWSSKNIPKWTLAGIFQAAREAKQNGDSRAKFLRSHSGARQFLQKEKRLADLDAILPPQRQRKKRAVLNRKKNV